MGQTAVIPAQIVDVAARSLLGNNTASADAAQTISFSSASAGDVLTVQGDGSVAFAAVSAGIGGSTGSTDNAVLRADGTAGDTLQNSGWIIPDIYTSSPNATVNHLSLQATGGSTNVSVSIVPKGTGAFSLVVPDGATTGGNARGANAVDLRTVTRNTAASVASGVQSFLGPAGIIASGNSSTAFQGSATAAGSFCTSDRGTCSGTSSFLSPGQFGAAPGISASVLSGDRGNANLAGQAVFSFGGSPFNGQNLTGVCQSWVLNLSGYTTSSVQSRMRAGFSGYTWDTFQRVLIRSGYAVSFMAIIKGMKSDGSTGAIFRRLIDIKNVGGTTSLETTPETFGTDYNPSACPLTIQADNTNDALDILVGGVDGEIWRWTATLIGTELAYGT